MLHLLHRYWGSSSIGRKSTYNGTVLHRRMGTVEDPAWSFLRSTVVCTRQCLEWKICPLQTVQQPLFGLQLRWGENPDGQAELLRDHDQRVGNVVARVANIHNFQLFPRDRGKILAQSEHVGEGLGRVKLVRQRVEHLWGLE